MEKDLMIDILMATYNGSKYIDEQIESIISQTYKEWRLIIRDDGSSDNTKEHILNYVKKFPNKIVVVEDNKGNLGYVQNFNTLMKYATSDYIMFCDQDDIWNSDKIMKTYRFMRKQECEIEEKPILVHTNLTSFYPDGSEHLLHKKRSWNYDYKRATMKTIAVECTIMMNRYYKDAYPFPLEVYTHGHWLALYCFAFGGKVAYLNESTMKYRQHENNLLGDMSVSSRRKIGNFFDVHGYKEHFINTQNYRNLVDSMVSRFYENYNYKLSIDSMKIITERMSFNSISKIRVMYLLLVKKYGVSDIYTTLVTILYYLFRKKDK